MTSPSKILRFDIETAPLYSSEEEMPSELFAVWKKRYSSDKPDALSDFERHFQRCSLFAEFSRVVCISLGYEKEVQGEEVATEEYAHGGVTKRLQVTSIVGDEIDILEQFRSLLDKFDGFVLGGHNIKNFDIPYLAKRYVINGMLVHPILNLTGKKPREINAVDTMEYRKMGGGSSTGLETICIVLGVPTPKDAMDGSQVGKAFFDGKIQEILTYCEKDVEAVYRCRKRMNRENDIVDGCDEIPEVSENFVGIRCWKNLTGIKDLSSMTRSQNLRFTRYIERYHADNDQR